MHRQLIFQNHFHALTAAITLRMSCFLTRGVALAVCLLLATLPLEHTRAAVVKVCTPSQLSRAISNAQPGDFVEMCAGRWADTVIQFEGSGTRAAPITLRAEIPGEVLLTGSSRMTLSGDFLVVDGLTFTGTYTGTVPQIVEFRSPSGRDCDDCRVTNLSILGYNPRLESDWTQWVVLHGKRNRLDHSHFKSKYNLGSMIQVKRGADQTPNNHRIDHNLLEDRPDFTDEGNQNGDTLEIGSTGKYSHGNSSTIVEFNYLRNIDSDYEVVTIKSSGNTIQYNVIESSRGNLSLRQGSDNTVRGNFFLGRGKDRTGGIRIRGQNHIVSSNYIDDVNPTGNRAYSAISVADGTEEIVDIAGDGTAPYYKFERADNVNVIHNTVVNSGLSLTFGTGDPLPPRNIDLANNIIVQPSGDAIVSLGMGSNIIFSNNFFMGANIGIDVPGIRKADPKLERDAAGIMRPLSSSPAIDAVFDEKSASWDMDGQSRTTPQDIGADEVIPGVVSRGHVSLCDVGPTSYRNGLPNSCADSIAGQSRPLPPRIFLAD